MNIHTPTPSLVPHICTCGARDSDPTWHRVPGASTVSPIRETARREAARLDHAVFRGPVARSTDPSTSWEAARSVTGIRESQAEVLRIFRNDGPLTDEELQRAYNAHGGLRCMAPHRHQSPSGLRTRRSELVARGLLRDTGERRRGSTGRRMIVWAAA